MSEHELRDVSARTLNSQRWTVNAGVIFVKPVSSEPPSANGVSNESENVLSSRVHVVSMAAGSFQREPPNSAVMEGVISIMTAPLGKIDSLSYEDEVECRICQIRGDERLVSPCHCAGSTKWVHEACMVKWFRVSGASKCELCSQNITIKKRIKPVRQWRRPSVSVMGGPCQKIDIWYVFLTLFSVGTVIGFAVFQVKIETRDAQTLGVFAVIYILCSVMIIARVRHFYLWFVNRSFFWQKWKTLNEEWTLTHKGQICEPTEVSVV